jgi:hypothetical protein
MTVGMFSPSAEVGHLSGSKKACVGGACLLLSLPSAWRSLPTKTGFYTRSAAIKGNFSVG